MIIFLVTINLYTLFRDLKNCIHPRILRFLYEDDLKEIVDGDINAAEHPNDRETPLCDITPLMSEKITMGSI